MPVRVIEFDKVVKLNNQLIHRDGKGGAKIPKSESEEPKVIKVKGSKGNTYLITLFPTGKKTCTCPGFGFRKTCKHINELELKKKG
jgi:hypothetical protein